MGGGGGESATTLSSSYALINRELSSELSSEGLMEMGEEGAVNNSEYEGASTRFGAPDTFIWMESAYEFDPEGVQLDCFSDFNQEGTAFVPPVLPNPVCAPTGPPGDHGISTS